MYPKDPCEAKNQYLIRKRENVCLNHYDNPKAFIEYSNHLQDDYKNIDEYNADRERKVLIVFDYTIADMNNNKNRLFTRGRKLNLSLVFITLGYFKVPEDVRLNSTHFSL